MLAVALILGIALWTLTGLYSLMMVCALTMMGAEISYGKAGRAWPVGTLAVALGYTALNIAVCYFTFTNTTYFFSTQYLPPRSYLLRHYSLLSLQ